MSPSVDPDLVASGTVLFRDGAGRLRAAVVVKATYALRPFDLAEPAPPLPLGDDLYRDASRESSLVAASDFAPCKRLADVVVVGTVHPGSPGAARRAVGVALGRGPDVLFSKRFVAVGDRRSLDADPAPLAEVPLAWERTWGGHGCPENPVGTGLSERDPRPPNLVDPAAPRRPVGLGPIAPHWPVRAAFLAEAHAPGLRVRPLALAGDLDLRFFQIAPPDQRVARLRGGEQILLVGLHPSYDAVVYRLPALHAFARLEGPVGGARAVPLAGDTLWIDADRGLCSITFRGSVEVATRGAADEALGAKDRWIVRAGMAPCGDVEETAGTPRAWSLPAVEEGPPSPTVDPVALHDTSGLVAGSFTWSFEPPKPRRVVVVKGTFLLSDDAGAPALAPDQFPLRSDEPLADAPGSGLAYASDLAPFKAQADVLLLGTAHAAAGRTTALVRLALGPLSFRVVALGPRTWSKDGIPGPPGPFAPVALSYAHAFGGPGFAANPAGTGFAPGSPPPLLEDPDHLIRSRSDRPAPACFAPVAPSWPARASLLGTYGRAWREDRWPYFPADFDPTFYQAAPPPLRCAHLRSGETFAVEGVRPGGGGFAGTLPTLHPRAFAVRGPGDLFEVLLRLDTVVFDTDAGRLYLSWRGSFDVEGAVDRVFVLREDAGASRSLGDVAAELTALGEPRLAPASAPGDAQEGPFHLADVLAAGVAASVFSARAARAAPPPRPPPPPPSRAAIEALVREGKSLRGRDLSGADLAGIDLSRQDLTGAILARAKLQGARLPGAKLAGVNLSGADAPASIWEGADLTGADLTGAKLARSSFARATLERASLSDADLTEARLDEARAGGAIFVGADLAGAEAGGAHLAKADLSGARLPSAKLGRACLDDAKLHDASAEGAVFDEASLADARFEKALLAGASFRGARAKGAVFERADLSRAVLRGADASGAVFSGAKLAGADLVGISARGATFRAADLSNARLEGADLTRASLEGAILRGARLAGASLYQAETQGADLAGAILEGALLDGTKLST